MTSSSLPRRDSPPPRITFSERSTVAREIYPAIDSSLKSLKKCSRRAFTVFSAQREELRILERLYYKGKNQHRSALFWKRVVEVRRYARRLKEMNIQSLMELLRCTFFGEERNGPKAMKGPWTHVPSSPIFEFLLERLSSANALLDKMHTRLVSAYQNLSLAMQSGAFLQLTLVLAGIISRMNVLIPEMQEALSDGWACTASLLQTLKPVNNAYQTLDPANITSQITSSLPVEPILAVEDDYISVDAGSSVPLPISVSRTITTFQDFHTSPNHILSHEDEIFISSSNVASMVAPSTTTHTETPLPQVPVQRTVFESEKKIKKKRKKNEIDDIFG